MFNIKSIEPEVGCAYLGFTQESTSAKEVLNILTWDFYKNTKDNLNIHGFNNLYFNYEPLSPLQIIINQECRDRYNYIFR